MPALRKNTRLIQWQISNGEPHLFYPQTPTWIRSSFPFPLFCRYERELAAWQLRQGDHGAAALANGGADRGNSNPVVTSVDPDDWDEVLDRGIDLKKVKRRLQDHGFTNTAYLHLVDAWRRESPKIAEAMQCYKTHIHNVTRPNWTAFLTDLLGANQIEPLKRTKPSGKDDGKK